MSAKAMDHPRFIFLKHSAPQHNFFRDLCEDIGGSESAVVISDWAGETNSRIVYLQGPRYDRRSHGSRARSWFGFLLSALWHVLHIGGRPVLFIVTNPPALSLVGYLQYKLRKRPYVLWIDDVWPDILVKRKICGERSLLVRLLAAAQRVTFRHAGHVISIGPYMLKRVSAYTAHGTRLSVIPTWVDTERIRPIPKRENAFARRHGQTGKITVMYSGNMGITHDMRSILEAARMLRHRSDIHFLLIGAGAQYDWVASSVAEMHDSNVTVLPLQDPDVVPSSLATAEIALVCLENGMEGISMPSKVYTSLAAGSAVVGVCAKECDLTALIEECDCGRRAESGNPQAIADAITAMVDSPSDLDRMRRNGRIAVEQRFSRAVCVARVRAILEDAERSDAAPEYCAADLRDGVAGKPTEKEAPTKRSVTIGSVPGQAQRYFKAALDRVLAAAALLLLTVPIALVALSVRVGLGSPILFRSQRAGRGGKPFTFFKFRTMTDARDASGALLGDRERMTRLGRLLRAASLDELPQLWNVLRGEMSLVGPRPLLLQYLPLYTSEQKRRHSVMPGITGWAQVNGRNELSWERRFELDVWYVDHWSFLLDLRILCKTVKCVILRSGVSHGRDATMPAFTGNSSSRAQESCR